MDLVSAPERPPGSPRWAGEFCPKPSHVGASAASTYPVAATGCQAHLAELQCRASCALLMLPPSGYIFELATAESYFVAVRSSPQRRFFICPALCAHPVFYLRCLLRRQPGSLLDVGGDVVCRSGDETVSRACSDSVYS